MVCTVSTTESAFCRSLPAFEATAPAPASATLFLKKRGNNVVSIRGHNRLNRRGGIERRGSKMRAKTKNKGASEGDVILCRCVWSAFGTERALLRLW